MDDKLLDNRIIVLNGEVDDNNVMEIIKKLLYLDSKNNDDISLYINSCGGSVVDGLALIDCMNYIKSDVATICVGSAYSMGALILASGQKGKRYALKNSEVMIHDISGGTYGNYKDISIRKERMTKHRDSIINILCKSTNRSKKEIEKAIDIDNYMSSEEAKDYRLIDNIIFHPKGVK